MTVAAHLGRRLRERREALGLSPEQLAARLGTSPAEVRMFEEGAKKIPPRRLLQAAEVLRVSLDWFFEGTPVGDGGTLLGQASRDVARFLAMPEAYPLISAFIGIESRERRQSVILHAQAAGEEEGRASRAPTSLVERRSRS